MWASQHSAHNGLKRGFNIGLNAGLELHPQVFALSPADVRSSEGTGLTPPDCRIPSKFKAESQIRRDYNVHGGINLLKGVIHVEKSHPCSLNTTPEAFEGPKRWSMVDLEVVTPQLNPGRPLLVIGC